ncbi:FAR1 DNA binding domain, zinc finger, SWIM-type, MULE transposase domain containing protein [Tanacetum coccineum]
MHLHSVKLCKLSKVLSAIIQLSKQLSGDLIRHTLSWRLQVGTAICIKTDFKRRICDIVWTDQILPFEFEREWEIMIEDFKLDDNKWLQDMFDIRESWILAFLRDELMSGLMRTTSRGILSVEWDLQMEKEASTFYTQTVFFDVQDEIYASYSHCMSVNVLQVDNAEKYTIHDMQAENKIRCDNNFVVYQVDFCKSEMEVECSCKHYDAYGLLCRHIFYVLRMNNIKEFPRKYLNKMWLKKAKPFNATVRIIVGGSNSILKSEVFYLYEIFESTIDRLVHDMDKLKIYKEQIKDLLNKAKTDVLTVPKLNSKDVFSVMLGVKEPTSKTIRIPDQSSNKGNGVHSRSKSKAEIEKEATQKSDKRRTCSVCGNKEAFLKKSIEKRRNVGEPIKDKIGKDDNKRTRTGNAFSTTTNPVRRENTGAVPKCTTCNFHHPPGALCRTCFNCNLPGDFAKDCRVVSRNVNPINARNPTARACYECGSTDHIKATCPSGSFDVIVGMDWLSDHKAEIIYHDKVVRIPLIDGKVLIVLGERLEEKVRQLRSAKVEEQKLGEIVVVISFLEVFPDDLSGLPPVREIEFWIELIPEAILVAKSPY